MQLVVSVSAKTKKKKRRGIASQISRLDFFSTFFFIFHFCFKNNNASNPNFSFFKSPTSLSSLYCPAMFFFLFFFSRSPFFRNLFQSCNDFVPFIVPADPIALSSIPDSSPTLSQSSFPSSPLPFSPWPSYYLSPLFASFLSYRFLYASSPSILTIILLSFSPVLPHALSLFHPRSLSPFLLPRSFIIL